MSKRWVVLATTVLLVAGVAGRALAQDSAGWAINPYAGVFLADDGGLKDAEIGNVSIDPALLVGGRLGYTSGSNWGFEAAYGYSPLTVNIEGGGESIDVDAKAHLYYGAVNYTFPSAGAAKIFLSAGAGGLFLKADLPAEFTSPGDEDSSNDLLVNVGGGLLWWVNPRWAVRADAKDHIEFCKKVESDTDFSICPDDDKALNHIEISGGIEFLVGRG